jgi:hypothetical protein
LMRQDADLQTDLKKLVGEKEQKNQKLLIQATEQEVSDSFQYVPNTTHESS